MEYDNWGAGQPRNFREKNSMMMFKDGNYVFVSLPTLPIMVAVLLL